MAMESGRTYRIVAEMRTPEERPEVGLKAFRLGIEPPPADEDLDEAVRLAESADVAIVCVGLNGEWDTEGMDRPSMDLPGRQDELINRVSKANAKTIAVLQSGGALTMPWLGNVSAVLQAWYPGQECGNAIADVLFGDVTPSGKLPQTFPRAHANNPAALSYPGVRGAVQYTESIYAGYRGYDAREIAPLFPFGYGLSYTTFAYRPIRLSAPLVLPGDALSAEVEITNTGDCSGAEIVQLYVHDPVSELPRPPRELKAFARLELAAGESATARFNLDMRSFAYFDDRRDAWVADAGQFEIQIGASSADIRSIATVELAEEWVESAREAWRSAHL
jgi:beta-glucosidase